MRFCSRAPRPRRLLDELDRRAGQVRADLPLLRFIFIASLRMYVCGMCTRAELCVLLIFSCSKQVLRGRLCA